MLIKSTDLYKFAADDPDEQLTDHFRLSELRCRHCGEALIRNDLLVMLEKVRVDIDVPMHVNSGYRCKIHNKAIGGARRSDHIFGYAADIRTPNGIETILFAEYLWGERKVLGIKRIGLYKNFVHLGAVSRFPLGGRHWGKWPK